MLLELVNWLNLENFILGFKACEIVSLDPNEVLKMFSDNYEEM